jgi:hypothetical protein
MAIPVAFARVPENAKVNWNILLMVLRIEWQTIKPELDRLCETMRVLHEETEEIVGKLEDLHTKIEPLLQQSLELKNETAPLWEDTYNLCGNSRCSGNCVVCLDGEEDYEDDYEEKYCRRGRR